MESARLTNLNLNLLVALDALLSERNVTHAARRVGITQPAMSQTLARLRELFADPLLVRRGRSMVLTPRAEAMLVPLSDALLSVERAVQLGMGFDVATSTRIFSSFPTLKKGNFLAGTWIFCPVLGLRPV